MFSYNGNFLFLWWKLSLSKWKFSFLWWKLSLCNGNFHFYDGNDHFSNGNYHFVMEIFIFVMEIFILNCTIRLWTLITSNCCYQSHDLSNLYFVFKPFLFDLNLQLPLQILHDHIYKSEDITHGVHVPDLRVVQASTKSRWFKLCLKSDAVPFSNTLCVSAIKEADIEDVIVIRDDSFY